MSDINFIKENILVLFEKFEEFLASKTVVGEPIKIGEITMIPIVSMSFGLGAGGGDGADCGGNKGYGGGSGVGAKVSPVAVLVIKGDTIETIQLKKTGGFEKLVEMVPELVDKVKDCCGSKEKTGEKSEEKGCCC